MIWEWQPNCQVVFSLQVLSDFRVDCVWLARVVCEQNEMNHSVHLSCVILSSVSFKNFITFSYAPSVLHVQLSNLTMVSHHFFALLIASQWYHSSFSCNYNCLDVLVFLSTKDNLTVSTCFNGYSKIYQVWTKFEGDALGGYSNCRSPVILDNISFSCVAISHHDNSDQMNPVVTYDNILRLETFLCYLSNYY